MSESVAKMGDFIDRLLKDQSLPIDGFMVVRNQMCERPSIPRFQYEAYREINFTREAVIDFAFAFRSACIDFVDDNVHPDDDEYEALTLRLHCFLKGIYDIAVESGIEGLSVESVDGPLTGIEASILDGSLQEMMAVGMPSINKATIAAIKRLKGEAQRN